MLKLTANLYVHKLTFDSLSQRDQTTINHYTSNGLFKTVIDLKMILPKNNFDENNQALYLVCLNYTMLNQATGNG